MPALPSSLVTSLLYGFSLLLTIPGKQLIYAQSDCLDAVEILRLSSKLIALKWIYLKAFFDKVDSVKSKRDRKQKAERHRVEPRDLVNEKTRQQLKES